MSFKEWLLVCLMLFAYSITMGAAGWREVMNSGFTLVAAAYFAAQAVAGWYAGKMSAVIVSAQRSAKATAAQFQALHEAAEELKAAVEKRAKEEGNVES